MSFGGTGAGVLGGVGGGSALQQGLTLFGAGVLVIGAGVLGCWGLRSRWRRVCLVSGEEDFGLTGLLALASSQVLGTV